MSQLVYRQPCEHERLRYHDVAGQEALCPGGVEQVLDPDKVLIHLEWASPRHGFSEKVSVADVLETLDQEER